MAPDVTSSLTPQDFPCICAQLNDVSDDAPLSQEPYSLVLVCLLTRGSLQVRMERNPPSLGIEHRTSRARGPTLNQLNYRCNCYALANGLATAAAVQIV